MNSSPRRLRLPTEIVHLLAHLPPPLKRKIRGGLDCLLKNPQEGKPLRADLAGLRSLKVGRFRIIYRLSSAPHLEIVAIGPRESIYKNLSKKL